MICQFLCQKVIDAADFGRHRSSISGGLTRFHQNRSQMAIDGHDAEAMRTGSADRRSGCCGTRRPTECLSKWTDFDHFGRVLQRLMSCAPKIVLLQHVLYDPNGSLSRLKKNVPHKNFLKVRSSIWRRQNRPSSTTRSPSAARGISIW